MRGQDSPDYIKARRRLQRRKKRYMELREELMEAGEIPVEPSGAIRDERVDPAKQKDQPLPALVGEAVRRGWAVPEAKKPVLVDEMTAIIDDPEESNKVKVAAFNALRQADQSQWERDNPKEDKAAPGVTVLNVVEVIVDGKNGANVGEAAAIPQE